MEWSVGRLHLPAPRLWTAVRCKNGDVISATIIGNVITAYKNGAVMGQTSDPTFTAGTPGIGFNLENGTASCRGTNDRYGFSAFSATDTIGLDLGEFRSPPLCSRRRNESPCRR